jgi:hypothetical protein
VESIEDDADGLQAMLNANAEPAVLADDIERAMN